MVSNIIQYRISSVKNQLQVLRETLERRVNVDEVIDSRLTDIECELSILTLELAQTK